jgi:hypothetical protein
VTSVFINTQVEVDMSEIDESDLIDELERRGKEARGTDLSAEIQLMAEAFYVGNTTRAIELAKQIARDVSGKLIA